MPAATPSSGALRAAASERTRESPAFEAVDVRHRLGDRDALARFDLSVQRGQCSGLLGPNGAGKSTALGVLTTQLPLQSGTLRILGYDSSRLGEIRSRLGVVFQAPSLDPRLSVFENLDFYLALHRPELRAAQRRDRVREELQTMGVLARIDEEAGRLSWGLRRRAEVARALLSEPEALVLDEPTAGLDPPSRAVLWDHVFAVREARGLTVLVATHDMEEAARCDRLAVLREGRIVAEDSPPGLISATGAPNLLAAFMQLASPGSIAGVIAGVRH